MDIEDVKDYKYKLASDIKDLINQFENQTGCRADSITIHRETYNEITLDGKSTIKSILHYISIDIRI